jgi:ketosteroid isomerase-like protein
MAHGTEELRRWVDRYVVAWGSNDPDQIAALFTEDATYFTDPDVTPWAGRDEIVREWLARKDAPDDHTFRYEVLGLDDTLGFVRGWTSYVGDQPHGYSNLWVVRLAGGGRASEFTEWWMRTPGDADGP